MRNFRRAFTLVELLTVIAIVGILAALIVPVVGKVKDSAKDAKCRSNLRQLHAGIMGYATDTGKLPRRYADKDENNNWKPTSDADPLTGDGAWENNLYVYLSQRSAAQRDFPSEDQVLGNPNMMGIFACPSDSRKHTGAKTIAEYNSITGRAVAANAASYTWNNRLDPWNNPIEDSMKEQSRRVAEVTRNPILLLDGKGSALQPTKYSGLGTVNIRYRHGASSDYDVVADKGSSDSPPKEGGHTNVLRFDGVVLSFKEGKIPPVGDEVDGVKGNDLWLPY